MIVIVTVTTITVMTVITFSNTVITLLGTVVVMVLVILVVVAILPGSLFTIISYHKTPAAVSLLVLFITSSLLIIIYCFLSFISSLFLLLSFGVCYYSAPILLYTICYMLILVYTLLL